MKSRFAFLIIPLLSAIAFAQQQQQRPAEKVGLAAALADDEKLISELSKRELTSLRDYMFVKNGVSKEQQSAYLAVTSVKQLADSKLTRKQQQELIHNVALGIDKVLSTMNDPAELMRLNASLVVNGTARHVNVLEYFGETPKVQSELRPIAEAVDRVYDKAIASAQKKADDIANQMTSQNQNRLAPEW
ncbi:MAG TPA: hypothetical protein VGP94_16675, partial [Tepidisphaeraceae bacterium]|nr:hypothetical protein [Tepidisphaeraceae bacterium]